jgi:hypothetical protein
MSPTSSNEPTRSSPASPKDTPADYAQAWFDSAAVVLAPLGHPVVQAFRASFEGFTDIPRAYAGAQAATADFLRIGIAYLQEVSKRMPDYAESAQEQPPVTMNFNGDVYGGQFAGLINNINSTINGIAQSGRQEVADALQSLEQAVLADRSLGDADRQDLLENVADLVEVAQTSPAERRRGRFRAALDAIKSSAETGTALAKALQSAEPVLRQILN